MDLGDAKYTIGVNDKATEQMKGIQASMKKTSATFAKAGAVMVAAGAAIVASVFKMADSYTKAGDEVAKMAKRTGFTTEALSELRHAANLSGSSLASIEKGVKRMSSTIEDAKDGLETYTRSFDKLGLSVQDFEGLNPEEQFWKIANALSDVEDATTRAALAQDFFGRAGTDMLPMLAAGADGIEEMRLQAHELNLVFDAESAAAAEDYQDSITNLKGALQGMGASIIKDVVPDLTEYIEKLSTVIAKVKIWTDLHPELAENLLKIGGLLAVGGAILLGIAALSRAIVAINTALVIMRALTGPKGWITLAASVGIAAATVAGMSKLYNSATMPVSGGATEQWGLQIGSPEWEAEQARVLSLGSAATQVSAGGGGNVTVNVAGSVVAERELTSIVRDGLLAISENNNGVGLA